MKKNVILVIFLWLSGIIAGMQFAKFSSTIGLLQSSSGINELYSSWLLSSLGIIGIIFGVTSGVIVSKFPPLKFVVFSLLGAALASFLQATFSQPNAMLAIRIFEGFSQLILVSAAPTAMLKVTPKRYQALVMTFWGTFFGVAFLIMNLLKAPLISIGGWKTIFYAHAIFSGIIAIALSLFSKDFVFEKEIQSVSPLKKISFLNQHKAVYKEVGSVLPGLLFGCHTLMYLVFLTYIPLYFFQLYPTENFKSNFLIIAMPLFSLIGTFISGIIMNKIKLSPLVLIKYSFGAIIISCLLLILSSNSVFFLIIALLILLIAGVLQGTIFATIPFLSDNSTVHAHANGVITQMGNIGTTVGAPVFSMLLLCFSWKVAFIFPIICSVIGILLIFRTSNYHVIGKMKSIPLE